MTARALRFAPFALALATYLAALWVMAPFPPTGDEPLYLVTAHSIAFDGDVELRNQLVPEITGLFTPFPLSDPIRTLTRPDGRLLPVHQPGLPLLLAPSMYFGGGAFAGRIILAVFAALAAHQAMRLLRENTSLGASWRWAVWAAVVLVLPFITHATQVYPEVIGAFILTTSARLLLRPSRSPTGLAVVGLLAGALPWLHLRYLPQFLLVVGALTITGMQRGRGFDRPTRVAIGLALAGFLLLVLWQWSIYGSPVPGASYRAVLDNQAGLAPPPLVRLYRNGLAGLVDASIGVLPYAPVLLMAVWGVGLLLARRPLPAAALLVSFGSTVGAALLPFVTPGGSLQGRFSVMHVPLFVLPIAAVVASSKFGRAAFVVLASFSLVATMFAVSDYWRLYPNAWAENRLAPIRPIAWIWPRMNVPNTSFGAAARDLPSIVGVLTPEGDRYANRAIHGHGVVVYGPYAGLAPGDYRATLEIAARGEAAGSAGYIEILVDDEVVARRVLEYNDLGAPAALINLTVPFSVRATELVSQRVVIESGELWVRRVDATRIGDLGPMASISDDSGRMYRLPDLPKAAGWIGGIALLASVSFVAEVRRIRAERA